MMEGQQQLFCIGESYTRMVNAALRDKGDLSLQAEVSHLQTGEKEAQRLMQEVVSAHQAYYRQQRINDIITHWIRETNAYKHLYRCVVWEHAQLSAKPKQLRQKALYQL